MIMEKEHIIQEKQHKAMKQTYERLHKVDENKMKTDKAERTSDVFERIGSRDKENNPTTMLEMDAVNNDKNEDLINGRYRDLFVALSHDKDVNMNKDDKEPPSNICDIPTSSVAEVENAGPEDSAGDDASSEASPSASSISVENVLVPEANRIPIQLPMLDDPKKPTNLSEQLDHFVRLQQVMLEMQAQGQRLARGLAQNISATARAAQLLLEGGGLQTALQGLANQIDGHLFDMHGNRINPPSSKTAYVKVNFLRIHDIDTIAQQFEAEAYIEARWLENKYIGLSAEALSAVEFYDCWDPQLKIMNVVGRLDKEKTRMVLRYEPEFVSPVLVYMWHVDGTFRERMELQHYPFDVQEMSIVISSSLPSTHVELLEDVQHDSCVNITALKESVDWIAYRHVHFVRDVATRETMTLARHPILIASAHVKRRLGSCMWNAFAIVLLILLLTFTFLAIDPTTTDRLGPIITLFLTAIAFKLVANSNLPTVSYLTYLDIYVVFAVIYLFLQCAESGVMIHLSKYKSVDHVREYDEKAQSCLIALLVLFHLLFIIFLQFSVLGRRRQMSRLDHDRAMAGVNREKERMKRREAQLALEHTKAGVNMKKKRKT